MFDLLHGLVQVNMYWLFLDVKSYVDFPLYTGGLHVPLFSHEQISRNEYDSQCLQMTLTYDPTHELDLRFSKQIFSNSHLSEIVCPIDTEGNGYALIGRWVNYMTLTLDATYVLDFEFQGQILKLLYFRNRWIWHYCRDE